MGIYTYVRDITKRNKKKMIIGGGIALATYLIGNYVSRKVNEFQDKLKEENATRQLIKKRFSQTQRDCYITFLSFLPILLDPIYADLNVEDLTAELRKAKSRKSQQGGGGETISNDGPQIDNDLGKSKSKTELWQQLKISSLTRFLTLIYSQALLIVLLHLQLNIISRKSYMKTALKLASKQQGIEMTNSDNSDDEEELLNKDLPEQAFLSLSWWILNKGWKSLKNIIEQCVKDTFEDLDLRGEISMDEFSNLIANVQRNINIYLNEKRPLNEIYDDITSEKGAEEEKSVISSLVLPPQNLYDSLIEQSNSIDFLTSFNLLPSNKDTFNKLIHELQDYLSNNGEIINIISVIGVSKILLKTHNAVAIKNDVDSCKLALIIASLTAQTSDLSKDEELLLELNNIEELDDLSASVYSNFNI